MATQNEASPKKARAVSMRSAKTVRAVVRPAMKTSRPKLPVMTLEEAVKVAKVGQTYRIRSFGKIHRITVRGGIHPGNAMAFIDELFAAADAKRNAKLFAPLAPAKKPRKCIKRHSAPDTAH